MAVQPLQRLAVLLPQFLGNPYYCLGVQPGRVRENLPEMIMVRGAKLIFDDHDSLRADIPSEKVTREVPDGVFTTC